MSSTNKVEPSIGIDLGTTYSCVGYFNSATNRVEIIANSQGNRTTPSYVAFNDSERLIGNAAKNQISMNPANTIFDAKRLIGRNFSDKIVQEDMKHWPFRVIQGDHDKPKFEVEYKGESKQFTPEQISAMILTNMKETAETYLGVPVKNAVITVPAYFNDSQRQSTQDAATIAGLNCLRIINEPTAAAIAYGLEEKAGQKQEMNILIFDFGGGTFDVSVICLDDGVFEVKATNGDTHLGGEDLDSRLVDHCIKDFQTKHGKDLKMDPRAIRRLRTSCERAKQTLSASTEATLEIDCLFQGIDYHTVITRARFESLCMDLFKKCMIPVDKVLADAKMSKSQINEVVLVGGSTRIPKIQQLLKEYFNGKEPSKEINPDESVAYGAAIQSFILSGGQSKKTQDVLLIDVIPLSLGLETGGRIMTKLIPRNSRKPNKKSQIFTTAAPNQTSVTIRIFEGERELTKDNTLLGTFDLDGIAPGPPGSAQIEVTFDLDANGILNVMAKDLATKKDTRKIINNDRPALSQAELDRLIQEAEDFKEDDAREKKKIESRMGLESLVHRVKTSLDEPTFKDKVSDDKVKEVTDKCEEIRQWLDANFEASTEDCEAKQKELEAIFHPIMSQMYASGDSVDNPMDQPTEPVATGPKVEEVD